MSEFKGTPGPWKYTIRNVNEMMTTFHGVVMGDTYSEIATRNEREDAQLISAAPELLEALQDMLSGWEYIRSQHGDLYGVGWDRAQNKAKSAISKALGK